MVCSVCLKCSRLLNHLRPLKVRSVIRFCHRAIQNKWCAMLTDGNFLLHDNSRLHTGAQTPPLLDFFRWEVLENFFSPSGPDLVPNYFHFFRPHKYHLGNKHYYYEENMKTTVIIGVGVKFPWRGIQYLVVGF